MYSHKNRTKQHPSRAAVLYGSTKLDRDWEDKVAERIRVLVSRDGLEPEAA